MTKSATTFVLALLLLASPLLAAPREVAVTFDDLPDINADDDPVELQEELTARLIDKLRASAVPAIGFVNEDKLRDDDGQLDPRRVALLERWLAAGLDL